MVNNDKQINEMLQHSNSWIWWNIIKNVKNDWKLEIIESNWKFMTKYKSYENSKTDAK